MILSTLSIQAYLLGYRHLQPIVIERKAMPGNDRWAIRNGTDFLDQWGEWVYAPKEPQIHYRFAAPEDALAVWERREINLAPKCPNCGYPQFCGCNDHCKNHVPEGYRAQDPADDDCYTCVGCGLTLHTDQWLDIEAKQVETNRCKTL